MVNVANDIAELQFSPLVFHKDFFCDSCFVNTWEAISDVWSIWRILATAYRGVSTAVEQCLGVQYIKRRRIQIFYIESNVVVNYSWLAGIRDCWQVCSSGARCMSMVWSIFGSQTFNRARKTNLRWYKTVVAWTTRVQENGDARTFQWRGGES
jgi:hypothetical protein